MINKPLRSALLAISAGFILATASQLEASAQADKAIHPGLAGVTVLIIRHAEKPSDQASGGPGLTLAGETRAQDYAAYFQQLRLDGGLIHLDALIATADSAKSARPRLTLQPLSRAIGLPIQQPFGDDEVEALAQSVEQGPAHRTVLIAWHHHKIPALLSALGADPASLLPEAKWPNDTYDWLIELKFDSAGRLQNATKIVEPAFSNVAHP